MKTKLQERLLLNRYLYAQIGSDNPTVLQEQLQKVREGYSAEGISTFAQYLIEQAETTPTKIKPKLRGYDENIKLYVARLNASRERVGEPTISLRYYQYLALLLTELYLDQYFTNRDQLRDAINLYADLLNAGLPKGATPFPSVKCDAAQNDLNKVAYWMATGSGKTLLMHINYWQYHYYAERNNHLPDNILLITPNEKLSEQHSRELSYSGINNFRYGNDGRRTLFQEGIAYIEITKLKKNKRGKGASIDISEFEEQDSQLIFVDEGHRGNTGDTWREIRDTLGLNGFTFEYSATFGQVVNGASKQKHKELLPEYGKAILFDYSYRHFHGDGYGKDYWILNVGEQTRDLTNTLMLGNLLTFYEQVKLYRERKDVLQPFNIEAPLWVFVGTSVVGGSKNAKQAATDVQRVVQFFADFLKHKAKWVQQIDELLTNSTLFTGLFPTLRGGDDYAEMYNAIVQTVLHGETGRSLRVVQLRGEESEIGLQVGADNPYFGVIRVSNTKLLLERFRKVDGLEILTEELSYSLFDGINAANSSINILIGAKMFIEGWDCYRVSCMGLINVGRSEGSQIIQLFGRGVRLRGLGYSLKRSDELSARQLGTLERPAYIDLLETLRIFGIRADYMAKFREYLEAEGASTTPYRDIYLPIQYNRQLLAEPLQVFRVPPDKLFLRDHAAQLPQTVKQVIYDIRPKVELDTETGKRVQKQVGEVNQMDKLRERALFFDWQTIYLDIVRFIQQWKMQNLIFTQADLQTIFYKGGFILYCTDEQIRVLDRFGRMPAQQIATTLLRKHIQQQYAIIEKQWCNSVASLQRLTVDDTNLDWDSYKLRVTVDAAEAIETLVVQAQDEIKAWNNGWQAHEADKLPRIYFDRHIYAPLLLEANQVKITPAGLNGGEARFVKQLAHFTENLPDDLQTCRFVLLRNLTLRRGISFFDENEGGSFFPDFILWILQDDKQFITFIDPHGMGRETPSSFKVRLFESLKGEWTKAINDSKPYTYFLNSFIISPKSFNKIRGTLSAEWEKDESTINRKHQVYFLPDRDDETKYIAEIVNSTVGQAKKRKRVGVR